MLIRDMAMGLFGKVVMFAAGIYAGIYLDQNYQIPKADDPQALWQKVQDYIEKFKKDKPSNDR